MRSILGLAVALLAAVVPLVSAQDGGTEVALQALPDCAVACLIDGVTHSTCAKDPTPECICKNAPLQGQISVCVATSCTIKELLLAKNMTDTSCGVPVRNQGSTFDATSIVLVVISCGTVMVRLAFKLIVTRSLSADDYLVFVLVLIAIPSQLLIHYGTAPNVGRDIWALTPQNITDFLFYFYQMAIFYFAQVMLIKLCMLFFYLRIFPSSMVRRLLWGTVIVTVLYGVIFVFLAIFQCAPISLYWQGWDGEHEGMCLNKSAIAWSNAAISIVLDIWMLAIPLFQLKSLNLHWKKKIGVGLMFCVGTFVTIVSIIRLQALVVFAQSHNATWDNYPVLLWSTVEINVGIMCTCMPTLRLMLVRFFPKLGGGSSYGQAYKTTNNSAGVKAASSAGGAYQRRTLQELSGKSRTNTTTTTAEPNSSADTVVTKPTGIVRQQTFAVSYDDDEASLVQMRGLDRHGRSQASRASRDSV
ncbi:hypothetical protein C8A00DRAFT_13162 [Chaetomidium leptoderma]|uniref:CFEM domain-containing protein n=1 Tax=Chaetomidium leptoderma TaxID=669021 RepID=A0AAN6VQA6_9PEZI|nr:hypothetical protein C8A00DRAFT_13162 [Chaetomidium leptoderma]